MSFIIWFIVIILTFYVMSEVVDKYFIRSLDNISTWLKLPEDVSGATLLALGTSAPEISTALVALFLVSANPATGVGTIVGSAIFQILVVVGFAAMVKTSYLRWKPVVRDSTFYAFSVILLVIFTADNKFTFWEGLTLVCTYFLYLALLYFWVRLKIGQDDKDPLDIVGEKMEKHEEDKKGKAFKIFNLITLPIDLVLRIIPNVQKSPKWTLPVFFICLGIIGYSSYWMVLAAESLAIILSIPPEIIALTVLAGGSSIPEMISSAVVAREGRGDMAIANAIGSNIFDILMSLGLPVLIYTSLRGDIEDLGGANISSSLLLLFVTLIAMILLLALQKFKVTKFFGFFLIFIYILYVVAAYSGWIAG